MAVDQQRQKTTDGRKMRRVIVPDAEDQSYRNKEKDDEEERNWSYDQLKDEEGQEERNRSYAVAPTRRDKIGHAHDHPLTQDMEGTLSNILARMPVQKVLQMRSVCRLWRSMLGSDIFVKEWEQKHRRWVLAVRIKTQGTLPARIEALLAYDDAARSWINLSSAMEEQVKVKHRNWLSDMVPRVSVTTTFPTTERFLIANSISGEATGLLCFAYKRRKVKNRSHVKYTVLVLNPITGYHRFLPFPYDTTHVDDEELYPPFSASSWRQHLYLYIEADAYDDDGGQLLLRPQYRPQHYRIFLFDECKVKLYIYRSRHGFWESASFPQNRPTIPAEVYDAGVDFAFWHKKAKRALLYSSKIKSWGVVEATRDAIRVAGDRLSSEGGVLAFRHGGRVLMAVARKAMESENKGVAGFAIYEMRRKGTKGDLSTAACRNSSSFSASKSSCSWDWERIASTPEHLCRGLYEARRDVIHLQTNLVYAGGLVCLTAFHHQPSYLDLESDILPATYPPLAYDIDADSWHHLPCPPPPATKNQYSDRRHSLSRPSDLPTPVLLHDHFVVGTVRPSFCATPWPEEAS